MEQEQSALVSSSYNNLPREAKRTNDSTFDRIYKYYHVNKTRIELTPEETGIRERWEKAWFLLCRRRTQKQVVELLEKLFSISQSVAYDDVRNAMQIFSNPNADIKDGKRAIAETMALEGANMCFKKSDMDGYHKFIKMYMDINGLMVEEDDKLKALLKNLKATTLVFKISPDDLRKEAEDLLKDTPTIDTGFEDVSNES
jgi:hypothetical protein